MTKTRPWIANLLSRLHAPPFSIRLDYRWEGKGAYPWLRESAFWRNAGNIMPGGPLVKVRQYSSHIETSTLSDKKRRRVLWTAEEVEILIQGYTEGLTTIDVAQRLPGRTRTACLAQAARLNIVRPGQNFWTAEEDEILIQGYTEGLTTIDVAQRLPGRTTKACAKRAARLNIVRPGQNFWTAEEDEKLAQGCAEQLAFEDIAQRLPGRTTRACRARAQDFNITTKSFTPWTEEEDEILKQGYTEGLRIPDIARRLPGRGRHICRQRLQALNFTKGRRRLRETKVGEKLWTTKETETLTQGFTEGSRDHENEQKSRRHTTRKRWTTEEKNILAQGIKKGLKYDEIAQKLPGRSGIACRDHAMKVLKITHPKRSHPWTIEETEILVQGRAEGLSFLDIAQRLPNRSWEACFSHAQDINISLRMPVSITWTTEEIDILEQGRAAGLTWPKIAQRLPRRSASACEDFHYRHILNRATRTG